MIETPEVSSSTTSPVPHLPHPPPFNRSQPYGQPRLELMTSLQTYLPKPFYYLPVKTRNLQPCSQVNKVQLEGLSDAQLAVLFEYDYLSGYSYFFSSLSLSPASLFGDDFSIFAKTEAEASFLEVDENEGAISADPTHSRIARSIRCSILTYHYAPPFLPASEILDRALDDDIKNSLQRFIK